MSADGALWAQVAAADLAAMVAHEDEQDAQWALLGDCFPVVHPPAVEPDEEAA
jgi:hypothetical protein